MLKARRVLRYLQAYQRERGYPPTQAEIRAETGLCAGTLVDALNYLAARREVVRQPRSPRGTYIPHEPNQFVMSEGD